MNRKSLFTRVLFTATMFAAHLSAADSIKPNILFIAVDDLRPELGCYGTPVIQNIADVAANKDLVEKLTTQWLAGWRSAIPK